MFSFNVAISRQPTTIKLYHFTTKEYPNLQASSTKELLYTRNVTSILAGASLSSKNPTLPQVVKAGRGWLGSSGDIPISQFCFTLAECRNVQSEIIWRGVEGKDITFSAKVLSSTNKVESSLTFPILRTEDGKMYTITVHATRFLGDSGWIPLLSSQNPSSSTLLSPDMSYGIAFWLPYNGINVNLPIGTYKAIIPVTIGTVGGSKTFVNIRMQFNLEIPSITNTINLTHAPFISQPFKTTPASSIYFLTNDETMGPTTPIWWGDDDHPSKMSIPLYASSRCKNVNAIGTMIIAQFHAQNQCGKSIFYEMNAGRGDTDCPEQQRFRLLLDAKRNLWRNNVTLAKCQFETPKVRPLAIDAYRWHDPNSGQVVGSMKLAIVISL
jgi:hypothetical protein